MSALPTDLCPFKSGHRPTSSLCDPCLPTLKRLKRLIWSDWEEAAKETLDHQWQPQTGGQNQRAEQPSPVASLLKLQNEWPLQKVPPHQLPEVRGVAACRCVGLPAVRVFTPVTSVILKGEGREDETQFGDEQAGSAGLSCLLKVTELDRSS